MMIGGGEQQSCHEGNLIIAARTASLAANRFGEVAAWRGAGVLGSG